ncbi:6c3a194e-fff7-498d-b32b-47f2a65b1330 [Thermothielavioides terrestris]|uniref:6c3a194e-fff7-498d-b32b-47f2a65b1330 n=1 Tax=Thermothielavioides terrestris TaxID=2587410 RepID=A0A3S4B6H3_9PEZI|nr:6c3a194e-fff7-498d-b32b-47f2a65b1330 [Thermothielavioides terrestris]
MRPLMVSRASWLSTEKVRTSDDEMLGRSVRTLPAILAAARPTISQDARATTRVRSATAAGRNARHSAWTASDSMDVAKPSTRAQQSWARRKAPNSIWASRSGFATAQMASRPRLYGTKTPRKMVMETRKAQKMAFCSRPTRGPRMPSSSRMPSRSSASSTASASRPGASAASRSRSRSAWSAPASSGPASSAASSPKSPTQLIGASSSGGMRSASAHMKSATRSTRPAGSRRGGASAGGWAPAPSGSLRSGPCGESPGGMVGLGGWGRLLVSDSASLSQAKAARSGPGYSGSVSGCGAGGGKGSGGRSVKDQLLLASGLMPLLGRGPSVFALGRGGLGAGCAAGSPTSAMDFPLEVPSPCPASVDTSAQPPDAVFGSAAALEGPASLPLGIVQLHLEASFAGDLQDALRVAVRLAVNGEVLVHRCPIQVVRWRGCREVGVRDVGVGSRARSRGRLRGGVVVLRLVRQSRRAPVLGGPARRVVDVVIQAASGFLRDTRLGRARILARPVLRGGGWRRVVDGGERGAHVDLGLLLHDVVSNEDDQDEADDDEHGDDLALERGDDDAVDRVVAREVAEEADVAQQRLPGRRVGGRQVGEDCGGVRGNGGGGGDGLFGQADAAEQQLQDGGVDGVVRGQVDAVQAADDAGRLGRQAVEDAADAGDGGARGEERAGGAGAGAGRGGQGVEGLGGAVQGEEGRAAAEALVGDPEQEGPDGAHEVGQPAEPDAGDEGGAQPHDQRAVWRTKTWAGRVLGMSGSYSLVKRKGVLHSSQCFFCECESHSIRQSWCTYLMLPLHRHGKKSGSSGEPSPRQMRHVSGSAAGGIVSGGTVPEARRRVLGNRTGSWGGNGSGWRPAMAGCDAAEGSRITPSDVGFVCALDLGLRRHRRASESAMNRGCGVPGQVLRERMGRGVVDSG